MPSPKHSRMTVTATPDRDLGDVYASEVATYAFCAKAWHLERVIGNLPTSNSQAGRVLGIEHHSAHGARVERLREVSSRLTRWTILFLAIALLLFALALAIG